MSKEPLDPWFCPHTIVSDSDKESQYSKVCVCVCVCVCDDEADPDPQELWTMPGMLSDNNDVTESKTRTACHTMGQ